MNFKIEFFMEKISNSGKKALNMLRLEAMSGVRSVTGSNYRHIMLLLGKNKVDDVKMADTAKLSYHKKNEEEQWKILLTLKQKK